MSNFNTISDDKLVMRFQSGDTSALPYLVKRHHKAFCNKAYWLTKDSDLSKDIAQDCWKIILDKIGGLKDPKSFRIWATRIVYTQALDALRAQKRKRIVLQSYADNQTEVEGDLNDNSDLKKKLIRYISDLPEQQQLVLNLFYVEDYSIKDIGRILKISMGTVKSRLFYARETLKLNIKK